VTITSAAQLKLNEAAQRLAEETARKAAERAAAKAQRVLKHLKWRLSHDANYGDQYNDQDKIG
jgi:membrane protein involved in colicin uptake